MEKRKVVVLSALVLCTLAISILGTALSLQKSKTVIHKGSVKGVGVGIYWDSACTNQTSSINWGMLEPGSSRNVTVYIRNEGNAVVTLSKTVQNWIPSNASSYFTLNWSYANQTLSVNQMLQIGLTLIVSSSISGITDFSFDMTVIATG